MVRANIRTTYYIRLDMSLLSSYKALQFNDVIAFAFPQYNFYMCVLTRGTNPQKGGPRSLRSPCISNEKYIISHTLKLKQITEISVTTHKVIVAKFKQRWLSNIYPSLPVVHVRIKADFRVYDQIKSCLR